MLRHAGISEIYTRGGGIPFSPLSLRSRERACLPVHNLRHVSSRLVFFVFYRLPFPFLSFSFALPASLVPPSARLSYTVICTFDYGTSGTRYNGSIESGQEWNERRQLRISRKMKGRHLRAENTRVCQASWLRSFPSSTVRDVQLHFSPLYPTPTLVGKSQFSLVAIVARDLPPYFFLNARELLLLSSLSRQCISVFLMEEKYRVHILP